MNVCLFTQECPMMFSVVGAIQSEELAEVEARVRQAIVKKDVVIANLRKQLMSAHVHIKNTEFLLQREHNALISEP